MNGFKVGFVALLLLSSALVGSAVTYVVVRAPCPPAAEPPAAEDLSRWLEKKPEPPRPGTGIGPEDFPPPAEQDRSPR